MLPRSHIDGLAGSRTVSAALGRLVRLLGQICHAGNLRRLDAPVTKVRKYEMARFDYCAYLL